jgi:hypothetical protein
MLSAWIADCFWQIVLKKSASALFRAAGIQHGTVNLTLLLARPGV